MSVIAMSVRGATSPSMLNAVRPSRTATLKDVQPRYASFPIRPASLSPTRCQNSTTPSAPAFSIMSSMRDASATSSMVSHLGPWGSHERREDGLQIGSPFPLRLLRDDVPPQVAPPVHDDRHEPGPVVRRHVRGRRADLVEREGEDLVELARAHERDELRAEVRFDLLVLAELLRLLELLLEQDPSEALELRGDGLVVRRQDVRVHGAGLEEVPDDDGRLDDVREDPLHLRDLDGLRRQEHEERPVPDPRDHDGPGLELLDGHHHVLPAELVADVGEVPLEEVQEPVLTGVQLVRDRGGEDPAVDPEEHRDAEVRLLPGPPELRLEEVLEMARRRGAHRLVDRAGIGHLRAPLEAVRAEDDLEGLLGRVVIVPGLLHTPDLLHDPGRGLEGFRGPDRVVEDPRVGPPLLLGNLDAARAHDDPHAAGEEVGVDALSVMDPSHLDQLERAVESAADRVILQVDRPVGEADGQEDVLPDRLARSRMLLDRAQDDAELLEGVEQLPNQLALLELV